MIQFPLPSCFLALPLEDEAKWQFQALQEELKPYEDCLRFQNPQSPHLTLQFWKELMEIEYHQVVEQTKKIAEKHRVFSLQITGADTFNYKGEDTVLYLTVQFSDELARLKKSCPWASDKPFAPHITIARIRHQQKFRVQKKRILKASTQYTFTIPCTKLCVYAEIQGRKQTQLYDYPFTSTL